MIGICVMYKCGVGCPPSSCNWPSRKVGCKGDLLIDKRETTAAFDYHLHVCRSCGKAGCFRANSDLHEHFHQAIMRCRVSLRVTENLEPTGQFGGLNLSNRR